MTEWRGNIRICDIDVKNLIKERPILFKGEMVNAILEGRKTQTRRIIKPFKGTTNVFDSGKCPYGEAGDRLWVRETWMDQFAEGIVPEHGAVYRATDPDYKHPLNQKWKPSIFMPRWASRIDLEVVKVRVERLQDISEADAAAEGVLPMMKYSEGGKIETVGQYKNGYLQIWEAINGKESWIANPWVWVIEFTYLRNKEPLNAK